MREAITIPPTKDNLLKYKRKLKLVERAYDLLREKYEALLMKLHIITAEVRTRRREMEKNLSESYIEYVKTESELGRDMINIFSDTVPKEVAIDSKPLEYMGVVYNDLNIEHLPELSYGFFGISSLLWVTARRFRETFELVVQIAEIEALAYRIIRSLQSIQLNLNALDKIYRVRFQKTIKHIEDVLESNELENIYTIKKLKQKMENKKIKMRGEKY
ncbi:MAG: V-type ATP synthase subunit D [Candidatus Heimdallarchaeota archaeon]|nr:V-type ATP synthase subunit D [Candidatus Heimdallarchaeota archaeon]MCK4878443.1 V-type ATP synthase subunit D [Candidatus Heimdallarchaeota archaeon]